MSKRLGHATVPVHAAPAPKPPPGKKANTMPKRAPIAAEVIDENSTCSEEQARAWLPPGARIYKDSFNA
eukprot:5490996-Lingulodinium_polyedra.AAC.1